MRRSLLVLVFVLALAAPARAGELRLWACHGPSGAGLPFSFATSRTAEGSVAAQDGGCATAGGVVRLAFSRPDPGMGQSAALRFDVPRGVTLSHVQIGRRALGPGYVARTSSRELEREDDGQVLDGMMSADAGGEFVELRITCATDPRCDAPAAELDFRFAVLTVRDLTPPALTVAAPPRPATGTIALDVEASDVGIGLARATASVDGQAVVTRAFDGCRELSPSDGTIDLSLTLACAPAGSTQLGLDTTAFADGAHRVELSVADGAGNVRTRELELLVRNAVAPTTASGPAPAPPPAPARVPPPVPTTRELVRLPRRLTVSRTGTLAFSVLCPASAARPCRHQLAIAAGGRDIASGTGTAAPGARTRIVLKLSRAARRTLKRRRTLPATLILAGARDPIAVRLRSRQIADGRTTRVSTAIGRSVG